MYLLIFHIDYTLSENFHWHFRECDFFHFRAALVKI